MNRHLFLDFETTSNNPMTAAVIDCAAIVVDWEKFYESPYTMESLADVKRFKVSVSDQVTRYPGFEVSRDTMAFWSSLSKEIQRRIAPRTDDLTLKEFTQKFLDYLDSFGKISYWWSRSNTFDPVILQHIFMATDKFAHLSERLKFWRVRDTRTYIDAKFDFSLQQNAFVPIADQEKWKTVFQEHNSSWDVLADVLRLQAIVRSQADLPQV